MKADRLVFAVAQRDNDDEPTPEQLYIDRASSPGSARSSAAWGGAAPAPGRAPRQRLELHHDRELTSRPTSCRSRRCRRSNENDPAFAALYRETRERATELGEQRGHARGGRAPGARPGDRPRPVRRPRRRTTSSCPSPRSRRCSRPSAVEERLRRVLIHVQRQIGMLDGAGRDPDAGAGGAGRAAARDVPPRAAQGDPEGAGRGRPEPRDRASSARSSRSSTCPGGPRRGRARARPARARRPRVDGGPGHPHLPRVGRRAALEHPHRRQPRPPPRRSPCSTRTTTA